MPQNHPLVKGFNDVLDNYDSASMIIVAATGDEESLKKSADWMNLFVDGTNLGRDYLYLGESYSIAELIEWSNYIIINLNDKSFTYTPWLNFSLSDNVDFDLTANIPYVNDDSEFKQFEKNIAVRLKVYF